MTQIAKFLCDGCKELLHGSAHDPPNYCRHCGSDELRDVSNDPDRCNQCGYHRDAHGIDQRTLEPTKCPVPRQASHTPPQEYHTSPRGDY